MLHDLYQVWVKPIRPKGGPYPASNGGQAYEKNKEIKKKPEQKKVKQMTKEKIPKAISTPPKKNEPVWKPKEETPKFTTTPPRTNKMVWRPKKEQPSTSTSLGSGAPSSKN